MGFGEDLVRLSGSFKESMQGLAQTKAFERAANKADQLQAAEMDDFEKRAQAEQIAQGLAQDLIQTGAPVSRVQSAFESFKAPAPKSGIEDIRAGFDVGGQAGEERVQRGLGKRRAAADVELQKLREQQRGELRESQMRLQSQQLEDQQERRREVNKLIRDASDDFFKRNKKLQQKVRAAKDIETFMTPVEEDGDVDVSQFNQATKALAKTVEGGRLTDKDFELARVNPDILTSSKRNISKLITGDAISEDVEELRKITRVIQMKAAREVAGSARNFARARAKRIQGASPEEVQETALLEFGLPPSLVDQVQGRGAQPGPKPLEELRARGMNEEVIQAVIESAQTPDDPESRQILRQAEKLTGIKNFAEKLQNRGQ